ncbi:zinc finger ZZ-type and EF-hand domain-containing protein 1-like isoform X2 [Corticium candelabrum]|uniref:zinc finger ZZ-type and EF-hand domain-containing protein 1-like isoform X2 n=1 Tax=Corticium candelabrum TaxID=121492 RepID=UPI002E37995B|nr:zinc finger ZZ-type and EF-hand domain-containing protein 1-like isoform X2 [Corticium candelabrum]
MTALFTCSSRFGGYVTLLENCKKEYSVIQINIKRCHSDGCDARVRVVTVKGLRPDTAREGSLLDSSALWLLQLVRSTAVASIPSTPQLRNIILSQSKSAVMAMPPLSLAIGSTQRPVGLSGVVLEEVTDFMYSLLYDQSEGMSTDGLHSLLGLSVARGNVVNILKVLRLLFDNSDVQLSVCHLCYQMTDTSDTCKRSHGEQLSIQLVACDGGYKDDDNKPINVIYPGPDSFLSSEGKNKCNIVFKSRSSIHTEITQFNLKVSRGATGAKNGLVFVFDYPGEFNMEAVAKQLTQYDDWTATEYTDYVNSVKDALPGTVSIGQFSPVGYFETTSETDDIEVDMDFIRPGKYILLKLLGPRLVTAERVGVVYASFKGYIDVKVSVEDSELAVERLALLPDMTDDDVLVSGSSVALHLLSFTCALADDLERLRQQRRAGGGLATREPRLEMEGITLQGIWDTYSSLLDRSSVIDEACRLLLLQLLRYLLPYLSASSSKEKQEMKRDPAGHRQLTRKVFQHMCDIVDNSHRYRSSVQQAARDVILDGASVFFPDDETRHFHLMQMIDSIVARKRVPSQDLTFESMCRFFSSMDANSLLGLPSQAPEGEPVGKQAIVTLSTLVSVTQAEAITCLTVEQTKSRKPSDLVQLLCALQRSLCSWCYSQLVQSPSEAQKQSIAGLIAQYTEMMSEKVQELFARLEGMDVEMTLSIERLGYSFAGMAFRQLALTLGHEVFLSLDPCRVAVLRSLLPVCVAINKLSMKGTAPQMFYSVFSTHWVSTTEPVVLKTWDRESRHKYDNNAKIYETFECSAARAFRVDFDPNCETEKRYDYLEFIDSSGNVSRFDEKVGNEKWPLSVMFKSGGKLQFHFRSDSSTNEWGYKFTVYALGHPEILLCWMFDLQLHLSVLCGQYTSYGLISCPVDPNVVTSSSPDEQRDENLTEQAVWKTLFANGYQTDLTSAMTTVNQFLHSLVTAREGSTAIQLIEHLRRLRRGHYIGDELINSAVHAVFAALLWHSPDLHPWLQQLVCPPEGQFVQSDVPPGVLQAFTMAESLRGQLFEQRQRLIQKLNEITDSGPPASKKQKVEQKEEEIDPTAHVVAFRDKALFLLSVSFSSDKKSQQMEQIPANMPKWLFKPKNWSRLSSVIGSCAHFKQIPGAMAQSTSSAASAVLEFIKNDAYSLNSVKRLLSKRTQRATMVADLYKFAADFVQACAEEESLHTIIVANFAIHILDYQKQFARHYLDRLDGCGLALERCVQLAFYNLIKVMMNVVHEGQQHTSGQPADLIAFRMGTLHLLNIEWRSSDFQFMVDVDFVDFLLESYRGSGSSPRVRRLYGEDQGEEWVGDVYIEQQDKFLVPAKENFEKWYTEAKQEAKTQEDHNKLNLFIAVFCNVLGVDISCTGCQRTLSGPRYRCRYCPDTNLCEECYKGKVFPENHCISHEIFRLEVTCEMCGAYVFSYSHFYKTNDPDKENFYRCHGCYNRKMSEGSYMSPPSGYTGHTAIHHGEFEIDYVDRSEKIARLGLVQNYCQTSAWMTFVQIALTINDQLNSPKKVDSNTLSLANKLYVKCATPLFDAILSCCQQMEEEQRRDRMMRDFMMGRLRGSKMGGPMAARMREMMPFMHPRRMPPSFFMRHMEEEFMGRIPHELLMEGLMFGEFGGMGGPMDDDDEEQEGQDGEKETEEEENHDIIKENTYNQQDQMHYTSKLECYVGLLAYLLPPDLTLSRWQPLKDNFDEFAATMLIPALVKISNRPDYAETESRVLTTSLLGQLLACVTPESADQGVLLATKYKPPRRTWRDEPVVPEVPREYKIPGERTIDFFVKFGGDLLDREYHDTGSAIVRVIRRLSLIPQWQKAVSALILGRLTDLVETVDNKPPDMVDLFTLMTLAGYPPLNGMGSLARVYDGGELKVVALMSNLQDRPAVCTLELNSRKKRYWIKSKVLRRPREDDRSNIVSCPEDFYSLLFSLIKLLGAYIAHSVVSSQELVWAFALILKAVVPCVEGDDNLENCKALLTSGCLPRLFQVACRGTNMTRELIVDIAEIAAMNYFRRQRDEAKRMISRDTPNPVEKVEGYGHKNVYYRSEAKTNDTAAAKALEGLDEITRSTLTTIVDAVQCPMSWLRAIYELNNQEQSRMLLEVQRRYDGTALRPTDSILAEARKWEPGYKEMLERELDQLKIDVGVTRFNTVEVDPNDWVLEPEDSRGPHLVPIPSAASISEELREVNARAKAYEIVATQVKLDYNKAHHLTYILKLFDAVAILHVRRLMAAVFANWPVTEALQPEVLDHGDGICMIGFFDLIERLDDKPLFDKGLKSFIKCSSPDVFKPLSLAACQGMMRHKIVTVLRESPHNYENAATIEDKVHIPGAAGLSIRFDPRCQTEPICDHLILSTSSDYVRDYRNYHGHGVSNWQNFEIPYDTLYYKFLTDHTNNDWGWRFTVIGGRTKRYDIGYRVLSTMLSSDVEFARRLPLRQIWTLLVGVICSQIGDERLRAIGLLVKVLMVVTSPTPWKSKLAFESSKPDLRLLRPLWYLYTDLLNIEAGGGSVTSLVSPVLRGLTELFMVVETVAQKWGVLGELASRLTRRSNLRRCFIKGVMNVGILGSYVHLPSKATKALKKGMRKHQRIHAVAKTKKQHASDVKAAASSEQRRGCFTS